MVFVRNKYNKFYVYEPKKRLIEAAAFKDKVVQHSLCDNVLLPKLSSVFIRNNFAGQIGKGTLFGLNTLKIGFKPDYIRLIDEKGLLTDELRDSIMKCNKLVEVEDLYRPYKQKRKTRASVAIASFAST